jgi:hypothetical protein
MIIVNHPLSVSVGDMEKCCTFLSFGINDWRFQRIKHTIELWRCLKNEYPSKASAVLMQLLDYPLSNASLFSSIKIRNYNEICLTVDQTKRLEIKKIL